MTNGPAPSIPSPTTRQIDQWPESTAPCCIHQLLALQAMREPDATAIAAPGRAPLTYGGLHHRVNQVIATLNAFGVRRHDRVAMILPNGPEMAVAFLGVASGATAAPLNPAYRAEELDFYLSDLATKVLIVQAGVESPAAGVARARGITVIELSPTLEAEAGVFTLMGRDAAASNIGGPAGGEDIALLLHTSGTTSRPKVVPLTHINLCASAQSVRASLELVAADRCLNVMPLFHIHGLVATVLASLAAGATVICTPGFYAPEFFGWMEECDPTWYTAVPTMHQAILLRAPAQRETIARHPLRFLRSSSSALPRQVMADLEKTFRAPVIEAYGMTEAAHQMASNPLPPRSRIPGSVGVAAGPDIAIMGDSGTLLPVGEPGEVVIRGRNVMRGYENNPEANAASFTQGWFRTGDQGWIDPEGYLHLTGRLKEIINRGGEKISPREIDEVLLDHPAVAQALTFALPDPTLGEDVGAAVVLRQGASATETEIRDFVARRLTDFKVPRSVRFLDEIPKGPTGKLQRIGLAERLGLTSPTGRHPAPPRHYTAPRTPAEEVLVGVWAEVLKLEQVGVHDHFLDLGGDSMLAALLVSRIGERLRLELSIRSLFDAPTVADQAAIVEDALEGLSRT
jgi:acyl-CoA synthetase (AMP-forming)/AMP-acid ligase II/acyl carrier protein